MFSRPTTSAPLLQILKACFLLLVLLWQEGIQHSLALPDSKNTARGFPFLTPLEANPKRRWVLSCPPWSTAPCSVMPKLKQRKDYIIKKTQTNKKTTHNKSKKERPKCISTVLNFDSITSYQCQLERLQNVGISTDISWKAREFGNQSWQVITFSSLPPEGRAVAGVTQVAELTRIISHSGHKQKSKKPRRNLGSKELTSVRS